MARSTTRTSRTSRSAAASRGQRTSAARRGELAKAAPAKAKKKAAARPAAKPKQAAAARSSRRVGRGAEHKTRHTMYVCRSCVWTEAQREIDGKRQGVFLIEEMEKLLPKWAYQDKVTFRVVYCLGGCRNPCNVGFRSPGKYFLRFNKLAPDDAQALLDFAELYHDSKEGDPPAEDRPERLKDALVVRVPPPPAR